jgi:murein DD-endopeptidase MepM/ murein hydrolase activator NlpD
MLPKSTWDSHHFHNVILQSQTKRDFSVDSEKRKVVSGENFVVGRKPMSAVFHSRQTRNFLALLVCSVALLSSSILGAQATKTASENSIDLEDAYNRVNNAPRHPLLASREFPPLDVLDRLERVTRQLRPRDTLPSLFSRLGISGKDRQPWIQSVAKHYPAKRIATGRDLHFYFTDPKPAAKEPRVLKALEIDLNDDWILAWEKDKRGIVFNRREKPYDVEVKTLSAVIEESLDRDAARVGLNSTLLSQLVDLFSWDVRFDREMRKGDSFKLIYEKKWRRGQENKAAFKVLAADVDSQGQKYNAIYFEKEKGKGNYYDLDGRSLARAFLRFPLEFVSISSFFSHSRFHPILKVERPHNGVDFVAKRGTPVRAIGDGKIVFAGWKLGGYGRTIDVEHDSFHSSRYAHLQNLAKGIRKGTAVRKGDIIGYVGSSGRSTGPHLHFEFYKNRAYVDPLTVEIPAEDVIQPDVRQLFENTKLLFLSEMEAASHS